MATGSRNISNHQVLPLLLAGPIVRRASEDAILLWSATSQKVDLHAEAYVEPLTSPGIFNRVGEGKPLLRVQLGEHLFCHILELKPTGRSRFPTSQLVYYDIGMSLAKKPQGGAPQLRGSILSEARRRSICFKGERLPSLLLGHSERHSLRAIYGSCRKVGGIGDNPLAVAVGDFERWIHNISRRPTALFLVGDQIYADDTLDVTFSEIISFSKQIGGAWFTSPLKATAAEYETPGSRGPLVEDRLLSRSPTGFSIDLFKGPNHLLAFHEFAAAYLLSLNSELWSRQGGILARLKLPPDPKIGAIKRKELEESRALARSYLATVQQTERLMANVATYSLLDDHEITDDWNLNSAWTRSVRQSQFGNDIVRNGLLAYWSFQDLGNRGDTDKDSLLEPVRKFLGADQPTNAAKLAVDAGLRNRSWSFITPTNPRALFLDTRTKRVLSTIEMITSIGGKEEISIPATSDTQLVSSEEIDRLIGEVHAARTAATVLVTPSPLFSVIALEELKSQLVKSTPGAQFPAAFADVEHWLANPASLFEGCRLLDALAAKQVFVISGDVHFSFAMSLELNVRGRKFGVAQITSSALLNEHPAGIKTVLEIMGLKWSSSMESQAWWMPATGGAAILFDNFLGSKDAYETAKAKLGAATLELVSRLEPLHEPLPSFMSLKLPSRSIETNNTVGTLEFFGDFAETRLLSSLNGKPIRSRALQFTLSVSGR